MQGLNLGALGVETDRRGFVPVDDKMQVLDSKGKPVPHLYCIGDANGMIYSKHTSSNFANLHVYQTVNAVSVLQACCCMCAPACLPATSTLRVYSLSLNFTEPSM